MMANQHHTKKKKLAQDSREMLPEVQLHGNSYVLDEIHSIIALMGLILGQPKSQDAL